jgi:xylitol oxidase
VSDNEPADRARNWAGNVRFGAHRIHRPESVDEVRRFVARGRPVRALGTGHCFNTIADAAAGSPDGGSDTGGPGNSGAGDLIVLDRLPPIMDVDPAQRSVTVTASVRYGDLATHLDAAGFALHNLASLPHISVAGSIATGTHGSGDRNGGLATAVTGIEFVTATGELVTMTRDSHPEEFAGSIVALGALGIVTRVRLAIEPAYEVAQWVYEGMPWDRLLANLDDVFASAYSVSVLTRWDAPAVDYLWRKQRVHARDARPAAAWLDATLADEPRHPVVGLPPEPATPQLGQPGRWHERLPHFRLKFTPSVGAELQSEFFVPRDHAAAAIESMRGIGDRLAPVLMVAELRTVAADDLWLSPTYGRDSLALHFTWTPDAPAVLAAVAEIENALEPFAHRPHWGKVFTMAPHMVADRFERLADFGRLRHRLDPTGVFGNDFVDRYAPRPTG